MLLTEFFIKNRFFTLFLPRSFESCTYTHSSLGSFIPGIFDNVQQVPVRIAIVIRVVSSLSGVSSTPRSFVCALGCFDPLCVRSPLETLESGVLFHIWWLSRQSLVLHDGPPWKAALCPPYPTTPSSPRSQASTPRSKTWSGS